jgi:transposase
MLLSEGQMSDYKGAALMLPVLPKAREILGDKGYDADWLRKALAERGIRVCIPSKSNRKIQIEHDRALYRQRHKIENMFGSSRTGGVSTPATTGALIPSCPLFASPQLSSSGSINES